MAEAFGPPTAPVHHLRDAAGQPVQTTDPQLAAGLAGLGDKPIGQAEAEQAAAASKNLAYVDQNWGAAGKLGLGAFSGLTLGMGPGLLGMDQGHVNAAQTSGLYTAGDIAGTVLPGILSGGESFFAKGLAGTPAGLMSMGGSLAEKLAGGLFGESAGVLGKLGSAPLKMAARGATEGALINMGHTIGDNLIQNKPLSAEAIAASGVDGALFGGLIGGTLGTVGSISSHAVESMGAFAKNVVGKGVKAQGVVGKSLGMGADEIEALATKEGGVKGGLRERGEFLEAHGSSIGDSVGGKLAASKKGLEVHTAIRNEAIKELTEQAPTMIPTMERIQDRLQKDLVLPRSGTVNQARAQGALDTFWKDFEQISPQKEILPVSVPEKTKVVKDFVPGKGANGFAKEVDRTVVEAPGYEIMGMKYPGEPPSWEKLMHARDQLSESITGTAHNPLLADSNTLRREILNALDSEIRAGMEGADGLAGLEGISKKYAAATQGQLLARELEANLGKKAAQSLMSTEPYVSARDIGTWVGMSAIGHPASGAAWLAAKGTSKILQPKVESWMAQMAYNNSIGSKAAQATMNIKGQIGSAIGKFFKATGKAPYNVAKVVNAEKKSAEKSKDHRKEFEEAASRAEQLMSNNHQDKVRRYAESLAAEGYKDLAGAMMGVNQRAVMYLIQNANPRQGTRGVNSLRPQPVSKVPTLHEHKWGRMFKGVSEGPHAILEGLENGSVSRDTVQAFKYVYPELHAEFVSQAVENVYAMKTRGEYLPMDKIINLGVALDAPIDRVLEAEYVGECQMALNSPPADQPPPPQPAPPTIMAIDQTGLLTPLQRLAV